jgi:hypothetical protein
VDVGADDTDPPADDDLNPCAALVCEEGAAKLVVAGTSVVCEPGAVEGQCKLTGVCGACTLGTPPICAGDVVFECVSKGKIRYDQTDVCDGEKPVCVGGACVQCRTISDCGVCFDGQACNAGTCAGTPRAAGTPLEEDGNDCTLDACDGTNRFRSDAPAGTPCNDGASVCNGNGSCGVCVPGATQCVGLAAQVCNEVGQFATESTCAGGCVAGGCTSCTPDAVRCNGAAVERCGADGEWAVEQQCIECSNGTCLS